MRGLPINMQNMKPVQHVAEVSYVLNCPRSNTPNFLLHRGSYMSAHVLLN